MAAVASPDDPTALAGRVWILERNETKVSDKLSHVDDRVEAVAATQAVHSEQISSLRTTGERLSNTLDKVLWALIGLALTIAGSSIGVMLTIGRPG